MFSSFNSESNSSGMAEFSSLDIVCNVLNLTVIALCVPMKLPQIKSSFVSKDTSGISLGSVLLELLGYSALLCYGFAQQYPVGMYMEQGILLIQNLFLLSLIIYTRDMISPKVIIIFTLYVITCTAVAFRFVPDLILKSVVFTKTPLVVSSKLTQIISLYNSKNPGKLSAATWGMAAYGSYARMITCFIMTRDWLLLLNYTCAASLSSTVVAMILYYTPPKEKSA